eukprot:gene12565-13851_t
MAPTCILAYESVNGKAMDFNLVEKILENCPAKRVSAEKQEKNAPSCLRLTSKEEIFGFTFEKLDEELTIKAPLATLIRLGALRLTVSHTFLCKKLDKCGKGHLDAILKQVDADGKRFDHIPVPNQAVIPDIGRKIVIDNFNYTAQPHEMTLERQNDCVNWVAMLITENRVSGCGLDDRKPDIAKIFTVPNAIFLPDKIERNNQRKDYIALVGRQAVKHVKCLQFLEDVATKHIQHKYSSIMTKSTNLRKQILKRTVCSDPLDNQTMGLANRMRLRFRDLK